MDDVLQAEEEFDILGLVKYCLKKWLLIALAAIFGAAIFSAMYMIQIREGYIDDIYRGGASYYSITEFLEDNKDLIKPESPSAEGVYNLSASKSIGLMTSDNVKDLFIKDAAVLAEMRIIFDDGKNKKQSDYDFKPEFIKHFAIGSSTHNFSVSISAKLDTEAKKESAQKLLNKYIEIAIAHVYSSTEDAGHLETIERIAPVEVVQAKEIEGGLLRKLVTGGVIGAAAGMTVVLVIFFIDPRVKSFNQIKPFAKNLIAVVKDESSDREPILNIAARIKDDNTVLFATAKNSGSFVSTLASSVADECVDAGFKTVFIDFSGSQKKGTLLTEYIQNKKIAEEGEGKYDILTVNDSADWVNLLAKNSVIDELKVKYNKIIIAYGDSISGGAVVLSDIADKAVLVINQKSSRLKEVRALCEDFVKPDMCVGAYIYNSI